MAFTNKDWKQMPDGKEKYQAYLCGREWGILREAVRNRCGGVCERCMANEMDHVHHLTYERKYSEQMDDLQALCKPCHDFTHGKANHDPARVRPVFVCGKAVRSFYLAGKITNARWRDEIVADWSVENHSASYWLSGAGESGGREWKRIGAISECVCGVLLDYVGPWWMSVYGGGHADVSFSLTPHAYGTAEEWDENGDAVGGASEESRHFAVSTVPSLVKSAIRDADMIFAWIDSDDCLGTMLELGIAHSSGKPIVIASPTRFNTNETWLARSFADFCVFADSAGEAWRYFWANVKESNSKTAVISSRRRIK